MMMNPGDTSDGQKADWLKVPPGGKATVRLTTRAMACDFAVIMNPGSTERIPVAGEALERVASIEQWLSAYRSDSELSRLNAAGLQADMPLSAGMRDLLGLAHQLHEQTDGAFDMACGAQSVLWKACRAANRLPAADEIERVVAHSGWQHVDLNAADSTLSLREDGLLLDPGAIGKGYALDDAAEWLAVREGGPEAFLLHGGHSSLLARGTHHDLPGWPVGFGNPLLTNARLGTILLCNQAMATSGSNIQFFRLNGKRYGHILDPRTAWPVEGMLSVTVLAPSAAVADALSTAFYVMGPKLAAEFCEQHPEIGCVLFPWPKTGSRVTPIVRNISPRRIYWDPDQVLPEA